MCGETAAALVSCALCLNARALLLIPKPYRTLNPALQPTVAVNTLSTPSRVARRPASSPRPAVTKQ